VRDFYDAWIRIDCRKGDLIVLPEGIYHRFTLDRGDHIQVGRLAGGVGVVGQAGWRGGVGWGGRQGWAGAVLGGGGGMGAVVGEEAVGQWGSGGGRSSIGAGGAGLLLRAARRKSSFRRCGSRAPAARRPPTRFLPALPLRTRPATLPADPPPHPLPAPRRPQAMRLFVGEPVWTPFNRPQDQHPSRAKYVQDFVQAGTAAA
jgi:hypothetical protein